MANNGLYQTNELLHDKLKEVGFNTITFGDASEVDLNKQNIFPLCHISLVDRTLNSNNQVSQYQVILLDLVDENNLDPRESLNDFRLTHNVEDIFHDLSHKFNKAYQGFRKDLDNIVEVTDSVTLTAFYAKAQNKLAGYEATFEITIPTFGIC